MANGPALDTLNGMDVGGKKLKVQKASIGPTQVANFDVGITAISGLASQSTGEIEQSSVVQLLNMVTAEELMDNDDYEGTVNPLGADSIRWTDSWIQKSAKMSETNAASSEPSSSSRSPGQAAAAGSLRALARSLSNLTPKSLLQRHSTPWLEGNLLIERS